MTIDDLRVVTPLSSSFRMKPGRATTLDDVTQLLSGLSADEQFQVLEGMGAQRIWWCEEHQYLGGTSTCDYSVSGRAFNPCRMVESLVLPLPTPQEPPS